MTGDDNTFQCISIGDDALDVDGMPPGQLWKYVENREDFSLVEPYLIKGRTPTVFTIREMAHDVFKSVLKMPTEVDKLEAAVQGGLVTVTGLRSSDGRILSNPDLGRYPNGVLRDEEMKRFDWEQILEIGEVAFTRSFFRNRTERVYQLPRLLFERWDHLVAHRVARSRALQAQSNSAASPASPADTAPLSATASATQTSASNSAESTGATAPVPSQAAA